MANTYYSNFYLSNEIEDQYNSHLDLQKFCTVDNNLVGTPGMTRKINVYSATNATEKLGIGSGNTQSIEVTYTQETYSITLAQNRFVYHDEEVMTDPMVVETGLKHMGTDMFNTVNADIFTEFNKAPMVVAAANLDFDAFANAQAMMALENLEGVEFFAFVKPSDVAEVRKKLKDSLQYVEAFARQGYIGTVAGVNVYTKKDAVAGTIIVGTREAVTLFNKLGVEVETPPRDAGDANTRTNTIFARKYYLAAMTDQTKAVKILKGTATTTNDTSVSADKTYYSASSVGYVVVTPASGANPKTSGWYEIS